VRDHTACLITIMFFHPGNTLQVMYSLHKKPLHVREVMFTGTKNFSHNTTEIATDFEQHTNLTQSCRAFRQSVQANAGMVPQIRQRPLPS
jgi:hypothetical protein